MAKETDLVPWGYATSTWVQATYQAYWLTREGWQRLWDRQDGKCAGCGKELAHPLEKNMQRFGLKPQTDHRHRFVNGVEQHCTAEDVRGLLCGPCNRLLGVIKDNRTTLQNLVNYLKQHGDY